jgi:hypothetical protein
MSTENPVPGITCPSCGHANEPTRVFCHNCGVRLPREDKVVEQVAETNRTATATANALRRGELPKATRQIDWSDLFASAIASTVKLAILGAVLAAVLLALRTPENLPTLLPKNPDLVLRGDAQIEGFTEPGSTGSLNASPEQINTYLQTKIVLRSEIRLLGWSGENPYLFIRLGEGQFSLGNHFALLGHPIVLQTDFRLSTEPDGQQTLRVIGGSIGRLPLPAWIFSLGFRWSEPVREALQTQLTILASAKSASVTPEGARLSW